ncbi:MAG: HAD-IA family hydrolase [Hydrogenophilales bacterium]|nr:HAD-IA family hydrolase [Hydrogenophilales bacterium]
MKAIPESRMAALIESHEVILLDAYGVLVNLESALAGASQLIDVLNDTGRDYYIVSNSASKLAENAARQYRSFGLAIAPERIITAGSLLIPYFQEHALIGARCCVLGTGDSRELARRAGADVLDAAAVRSGADFEVLIIADQAFAPFWDTFDAVLGSLFRRLDAGKAVRLVLPNPDLIYPRAGGFGFTSGSLALILEAVLARRYPGQSGLRCEPLGKPHAMIFSEAARRAGGGRMVMIGDQLETDILGANRFGIDSVLLLGGVSLESASAEAQPTFLLRSLDV